MANAGFWWK